MSDKSGQEERMEIMSEKKQPLFGDAHTMPKIERDLLLFNLAFDKELKESYEERINQEAICQELLNTCEALMQVCNDAGVQVDEQARTIEEIKRKFSRWKGNGTEKSAQERLEECLREEQRLRKELEELEAETAAAAAAVEAERLCNAAETNVGTTLEDLDGSCNSSGNGDNAGTSL